MAILAFLLIGEKCLNLTAKDNTMGNMKYKFKNLQTAFGSLVQEISEEGSLVNSRGSKQKELIFQHMEIEDPTDILIGLPSRKFSADYAVTEWLWYLSCRPSVENIGKLAKIWTQIKDEHGQVESNYGNYLKSQWDWVIDNLLSDSDTRRATIVINDPSHKFKNPLDYPCTHYVQFMIRDNKLHMGVNMRSNDAIFGFCNDVFTFCLFQQLLFNELKHRGLSELSLGSYFHHAGSLHLYERHFKMADKILLDVKSGQSPVNRKLKLREDWRWNDIINNNLALPTTDLSKEDILAFVQKSKRRLFDEYS